MLNAVLAILVNTVVLPTPVGANITPISPLASPPLSSLSIPAIPIGIGCL